MQVGLEFGTLLGWFLVDFESKLGGKLRPSWHQNHENYGPKTMSKNHQNSGAAGVTQEVDLLAPKNPFGSSNPEVQRSQRVQGPFIALETVHFGPQGNGGG